MDKLVVFISWSGEAAKLVASALSSAIEDALPGTEPFVSEEDISKGSKGTDVISEKLKNAFAGIICLTKENLDRPWVLFEAGALSNSLDARERVCPFLIDLERFEVKEPLSLFQMTMGEEEDAKSMFRMLNSSLPDIHRVENDVIDRRFRRAWPEIAQTINACRDHTREQKQIKLDVPETLVEIMETVAEIRRVQIGSEDSIREIGAAVRTATILQMKYTVGDTVSHEIFGIGIVIEINQNGSGVEIRFEDGTVKKIRSNFEGMELIRRDAKPPVKHSLFGAPALRRSPGAPNPNPAALRQRVKPTNDTAFPSDDDLPF